MALFTDGPISGMEDLMAQDSQLTTVASVEGIDVTQKMFLAQEELALEITMLLTGSRRVDQSLWLRAQPNIANVVVTLPLKLWHTFRALEMVYGDAYSSQLNDRYAAKRDQFQERARWAYERVLLLGMGIAWSPIPRALEPQVVGAAGSLTDDTYYAGMTWTNSKNEEGAPSVLTPFTTVGNTLLVQPSSPPAGVAGWNVYIGTDPEALSRQNGTPIGTAQTWLQPDTLITGGNGPGSGQSPNYLLPSPRTILRG